MESGRATGGLTVGFRWKELTEGGRPPEIIQSDLGLEFHNMHGTCAIQAAGS